jgi:hypothetical protein
MLVLVVLMLMLILTASVTLKLKLTALDATLDTKAALLLRRQKESPLGVDLARMHCLWHRYCCCSLPVWYLNRSHCLSPWLAMNQLGLSNPWIYQYSL